MAQVLVRRGFKDAETVSAFLHPDYRVHNPFLMPGMREARRRLDRALQRGEPIAVHGDYDADGITATFLLVSVLRQLEADVRWYLPNRFSEGYGVSAAAVEELAAAGVKVLVTVDCGISARAEVARAAELGMDVIVTDHHELAGEVPDCVVVTPKLPGYPCRDLAGVGVAFKLAHALLEEPEEDLVEVPLALRPLADVVAVGTIADIVPLTGENRVLVSIGLGRLRSSPRPGLLALMEVAGVKPGSVSAGTVGLPSWPAPQRRRPPGGRVASPSSCSSVRIATRPCRSRSGSTSSITSGRRSKRRSSSRPASRCRIRCRRRSCSRRPAGTKVSSASSRRGWWSVSTARRSCSAKTGRRPRAPAAASLPSTCLRPSTRVGSHLLTYGGHRAACGMRLRTADVPAFRDAFVAEAAADARRR